MAEPGAQDPLEALRERIEATHQAAARLAAETAESARAGRSGVPPRGWDVPPSGPEAAGELRALIELAGAARSMLPEDLQRQLTDLVRQLLVLLRALLDWWIAQIERGPPGADAPVEDIPIA